MRLIVGLGNVGKVYEHTRHNIGFMVVRTLARRHGLRWDDGPARGVAEARGRVGPTWVHLVCPLTMMNRSGEALAAVVRQHLAAPGDTLVVLDDANLPLGRLRLRAGGSDGGHHGLASCLDAFGTEAVPRLRVGIGVHPLPRDLTEFVLSPFDKEERPILKETLERAVEACELWAREGMTDAMTRINVARHRR